MGKEKQNAMAVIASILAYLAITTALYYAIQLAGIDQLKAAVEAIVIAATLVTLVILYLFGRIWK